MANKAEYPTLLDVASSLDSDGNVRPIAEVLSQSDPMLNLLPVKECNETKGYTHAIRTSLPEGTWRRMYEGVFPGKSSRATVTDTCGNLEAYSEIDIMLAKINGNSAAWRLQEQKAFFMGLGQQMASNMFYADSDKNPERFQGLVARYNTLDSDVAASRNTISAVDTGATTGSVTSAWFISLDQVFGLFPKGSKAGLSHVDRGQQTVKKDDGSMYEAYVDWYQWQFGMAVEDWRGVVRVCNIPIKNGEVDMTGDALIKKLMKAKNLIPASMRGRVHLFCPVEVMSALENAALDKSSTAVKIVPAAEQFHTAFFGYPIEQSDSIKLTEDLVE